MSGNMSFSNNKSVAAPGNASRSFRTYSNSTRITPSSNLNDRGRVNDSTSFSEGNSSTSIVQDDTNQGQESGVVVLDNDVWSTRVILSGIEEIVFSETPFPKLPTNLILAIQKFLLSLNAFTSNVNPFVEFVKSNNPSNEYYAADNSKDEQKINRLEIIKEVMELLEQAAPESKVVLRTLVAAYIRNTATNIIEKFRPMLEASGGHPFPCTGSGTNSLIKRNQSSSTETDCDLKQVFDLILNRFKALQVQSSDLDEELREALKQRDSELKKFGRNVKEFKEITLDIMTEQSAQQDADFVLRYLEYVQTETHVLNEQLRLERLRKENEENPDILRKETNETYKKMKILYDRMLTETEEEEKKLKQYRSLGNDYLKVLEKYTVLEEEIKTKEWVKEQLQNGPRDDSLFSDSF